MLWMYLKITNLKSERLKSNIWASSGTISVNCFFSCAWVLLNFFMSCNFLLKTGYFKQYSLTNIKIRFWPFLRICSCCYCLLCYDLPEVITCVCVCVSNEVVVSSICGKLIGRFPQMLETSKFQIFAKRFSVHFGACLQHSTG